MRTLPWILFVILLIAAIVPNSFAAFILKSSNPTPGSLAESASLDAWWWGLQSPETPASNCEFGLDEVRFYRTFLQSVAAVASLGIWVPAQVEWTCAKSHPDTGTTG